MRINKSLIAYQPTTGAGSGTVTSVGLSAPTGFSVSGSPITSSGTLALAFATGYGIPPLMTGNSGKFLTTNGTTMSWVNIAGTDVTGAALTETDDTNVTMTLGGTPSTALLRSVSMTLGWAGQLAVSRGGSGAATLTGVLIGNGTSAFTAITGGPNQILRVNGTATGYEFYTASFLTNPMTLNLDMIFQFSGVPTRLAANITTTKKFLTTYGDGTNATSLAYEALTTSDIPSAALTKVDDTNVTLTLGGTPATSLIRAVSLTLGWSGTLSVSRGGTGASTLTGVVIGNGTSAMTAVSGTAGQFLRRNTANTAYEFRTLQGGDIAGSELTFTNDTNVTMSLSGTPASALLQPVNISLGWTGTLSVSRGGTGASTLTGVLIGNGTSAVSAVTGTAGQLLRRNAANTAYEFFTASLITGNGVADRVARWTSSSNLIDGTIYDNGTNVGIGIASPNTKLHTTGSLTVNDIIYLQRASGSLYLPVMNFWNGTGSPLSGTRGDILAIGNTGGDAVVFVTNAAERVRITSAGYVGINKTVPVSHLDVAGSVNISSASYLTWGGAYGSNIPTIQGTSGTSAGFGFYAAGSTSGLTVAFNGDGSVKFYDYQSPTSFTGTAAAGLAVTNTGDLITTALSKTSTEGNYTPTWTGITNVDSVTAFECRWMRIGDTLTVSGKVAINATVDNTATSASFTLPTSASNPQAGYMNGVGVQEGGGAAGSILGYGYNTGIFELSPLVDTTVNYSFIFTYRIV